MILDYNNITKKAVCQIFVRTFGGCGALEAQRGKWQRRGTYRMPAET